MKKLIFILTLAVFTSVSADSLPEIYSKKVPNSVSGTYYPGVRYNHTAYISSRYIHGNWCYAQWYYGYSHGTKYYYFYWVIR